MASKHKRLWGLQSVRFFVRKDDPTKFSLRVHCCYMSGSRKGKSAGFHEIHKLTEEILKETVTELSEAYAKGPWMRSDTLWHANCETALDYLFAELGRRANRKVLT